MRSRDLNSILFVLAVVGVMGVARARPSEGVDWPEADYAVFDDYPGGEEVSGRQEDEGSPGSAGSEGTFGSWWSERRPCSCANQRCGCCTGRLFPLPPWLRPRVCTNLTYVPDEFALKMAVTFNDVVMYRNKLSGRNPPPVCLSPPRIPRAKLCIKLQDVYLVERNIHACMAVEGLFNKQVLFGRMLGCMRMGTNGFAVVNPEDGGGLPGVEPADPDDEEPSDEDDYDQVDEDDYDPVEEDNTVESGAADGSQAGGTPVTAAPTKPSGNTKGGSKKGGGPKAAAVKTAGAEETKDKANIQGLTKTVEKNPRPQGSTDPKTVIGVSKTVNTTGVEASTQHQEPSSTTAEGEGFVTTAVTEEAGAKVTEAADAEISTESGATVGSDEVTMDKESAGTTTEIPYEEKEILKEEGDRGEVTEKSTDGSTKAEGAKETEAQGGEEKDIPSGQLVAEEQEFAKRNGDSTDGEIMGVGTVEEV